MYVDDYGNRASPIFNYIFDIINELTNSLSVECKNIAKLLCGKLNLVPLYIKDPTGGAKLNLKYLNYLDGFTEFSYYEKMFKIAGKTASIISYLMTAYDCYKIIEGNLNNEEISDRQKAINIFVDVSYNVMTLIASATIGAKIGAVVGSFIPVPILGTIIGSIVEVGISVSLYAVANWFQGTDEYNSFKFLG